MADSAALSAAFESDRAHLLRVAYGMLGSVADAEDVVQEAWLRLARLEDPGEIEDLRAWLTRVVGRLALDALRRARARRETYFGEWLPEPVVGDAAPTGPAAPDDRVTLAPALVNGWPGLVERDSQGVLMVMSFTVDGGRIVGIESIRNPYKLTHVDLL